MFYDKLVAIDDDQRSLDSLRLILQKQCEMICFSSGEAALEYLRTPNQVSLVMVDVFMKGMDGISVLHAIKEINSELPVIIMTAFGSKEVVLQALQNKADDFLEKPFNIEELKQKVAKFLRSNEPGSSAKQEAQDRMKLFVEKNYANVGLKDIAESVCLSEKYIGRLFKQKNNCNFRDYKIQVRLEKAKEMLTNSSYSVQHIARLLGYQNAETFMRLFKRKTGLTPSGYRKLHRKTEGDGPQPGNP